MRIGYALGVCLVLALPKFGYAQSVALIYSGDAINQSLSGLMGDASRGREIVVSRQTGLCILCHSGPFPEEPFQGNLAPDLATSTAKLSSGQVRARLVDARRFHRNTIMPSYFQKDNFERVAKKYESQTILSAQEIEDVVAFLASLNPSR